MCCGSENCADRLLPWPTLAGDGDGPGLEPELEVEPELPAFAAKRWAKKTKRQGEVQFTNTADLLHLMLPLRPTKSHYYKLVHQTSEKASDLPSFTMMIFNHVLRFCLVLCSMCFLKSTVFIKPEFLHMMWNTFHNTINKAYCMCCTCSSAQIKCRLVLKFCHDYLQQNRTKVT